MNGGVIIAPTNSARQPLPLLYSVDIAIPTADNGIPLIPGTPGYKISLRGMVIRVGPGVTVSGDVILNIVGFANNQRPWGGGASFTATGPPGAIACRFTPSTTVEQRFTYEFPDGCAETPSVSDQSSQNPWGITIVGKVAADTDTFDALISYWGQLIPV